MVSEGPPGGGVNGLVPHPPLLPFISKGLKHLGQGCERLFLAQDIACNDTISRGPNHNRFSMVDFNRPPIYKETLLRIPLGWLGEHKGGISRQDLSHDSRNLEDNGVNRLARRLAKITEDQSGIRGPPGSRCTAAVFAEIFLHLDHISLESRLQSLRNLNSGQALGARCRVIICPHRALKPPTRKATAEARRMHYRVPQGCSVFHSSIGGGAALKGMHKGLQPTELPKPGGISPIMAIKTRRHLSLAPGMDGVLLGLHQGGASGGCTATSRTGQRRGTTGAMHPRHSVLPVFPKVVVVGIRVAGPSWERDLGVGKLTGRRPDRRSRHPPDRF